jgi:hypothetical protein
VSKKKIPAKTTLRLLDAVAFMNSHHGIAFNGMITVNFEQLGLKGGREAAEALTKLNEALADRIGRYGDRWGYDLPHYFLYVHEDVRSSHGHHVHQLMVVPSGLGAQLDGWLRKWARRNYGPNVPKEATHFGGEYPRQSHNRAELQARMLRYVLKSSDNSTVRGRDGGATTLHEVLEVEKRKRAYCASVHRVAGTSQNISLREQLWAGFWRTSSVDSVFTDEQLEEWRRAGDQEKFLEMLRTLDI